MKSHDYFYLIYIHIAICQELILTLHTLVVLSKCKAVYCVQCCHCSSTDHAIATACHPTVPFDQVLSRELTLLSHFLIVNVVAVFKSLLAVVGFASFLPQGVKFVNNFSSVIWSLLCLKQ